MKNIRMHTPIIKLDKEEAQNDLQKGFIIKKLLLIFHKDK